MNPIYQGAAVAPSVITCQPTAATIRNKSAQQNPKPALFMRWLLALLMFVTVGANAQISVSGGSGLAATYTSFTNAGGLFAAINATAQTGNNIVVSITGDITTEAGTNSLNAGAWTTISITPSGARTVSGAVAGVLLNYNGADNVTVNGLNTGGNSLIIDNTTAGATSATIRFIGDAVSNTVTNCTIRGAGTATTLGTIFFSTGTTTGNDGNVISNNNITASGANLPTNGIYSAGSSTSIDNSGISVTGNNISDYYNAGSASNGIFVASNSSAWTITGNKLFQSTTRTATAGNTHRAINIVTAAGVNYDISNNTIGYATAAATGTTTYAGSFANRFIGIELTAGTATASSIQNNVVTAISLSTTSGATGAPGIFSGISVLGGIVNIGTITGNTIGATSGTGSIVITSSTTLAYIAGIYSTSTATVNIQNNNIGSFSNGGTASIGYTFYGINTAGTAGSFTITGNTIGSTATANSIAVGTSGTTTTGVCTFNGISNAATGTISITGNTIQNCSAFGTGASVFNGIANSGGLSTSTLSLSTNNIIAGTNSGTGAFTALSNSAVVATCNMNSNVIRNNIISSTSGAFTGITNTAAVSSALAISSNQLGNATGGMVTLSAANSGAITGITASGLAAAATLTITANDIRGIVHSVTGSGAHTYIAWNHASSVTDNINSNTFTNLNVNTTGTIIFFSRTNTTMTATSVQNCNNNSIVTGFNRGGAGSTTIYTDNAGGSTPSGSAMNYTGNNFSNITLTGASAFNGFLIAEGSTTAGNQPTKTITNNTFNTITTGAGAIVGISCNYAGNGSSISGNTISNISNSSTISGIVIGSSSGGATHFYANNTLTNFTSNASGGNINAISGGASGITTLNVTNNAISGLSQTGGANQVNGINLSAGTTNNISRSTICNLQSDNSGGTVNAILVSSGTTYNIYNNRIGDLRTPSANAANPLIGINITGGTTVNVYYNTVNLAGSSSGALFGSSAISVSTTPTVTLRNNIFSNTSSVTGAGLAVAHRRSGTTLTTYAAASDRNDFNASTIFTDGTNTYTTLAAYKTAMATRDQNSIGVTPSFLSTACGNANFLKINTAVATQLESGAANITGFTDDFENDIRQGNAGYPTQTNGGGTAPDIGADEFDGTPAPVCTGTPAASTINGANAVCSGTGTTLSLSTTYTDLQITYQWRSSTTPGGPYTTTLGTNSTQPTGNLTQTTYYIAEITCTNSGQTYTTAEKTVSINALPTVVITPSSATYCAPGGTAVTLNGSGATTYSWSPATGLNTTTGATVLASPSVTTTYTVTGTDANGCVNTATVTVTVAPAVTINSVTATPSTICSGANSQLQVNAAVASQPGGYTFTPSSGTFTPITGGTTVAINADDAVSGLLPIGFTFKYGGTSYTQVVANSNGWLSFNTSATGISAANSRTNSLTAPTSTLLPMLAPLWDDLDGASTGAASYLTTGSAPNRVFTFQWLNWEWDYTANAAVISFQVKLYEADNHVEFVYRSDAAAYATGGTAGGASIGITGAASGNFLSLNGTGASPTASNATETSTLAAKPASGQIYSFSVPTPSTYSWTPSTFLSSTTIANPVANAVTATTTYTVTASQGGCSATGNVTVTVSNGAAITSDPASQAKCAGQTATFTVVATGAGLTYQWRKGGVDIPIGGNASAGTATLTLPNVTAADNGTYDVVVSSSCGSPVTSAGATLTVTTPLAGINPSATTICSGQSVTLTENGGTATSWSWAPGGQTTQAITVSPSTTTTYTVTATVNSCSATATQTITVNPTPSAVVITPSAATICAGASVGLTVTGGSVTQALTFNASSGNINQSIPDNSSTGTSNTLAVSGVPAGSTIDSVIVTFNITHAFSADAEVNLVAPNGQIINLMADEGSTSTSGFVNTRVSSDGTKPAFSSGTSPFTGTFKADAAAQASLIGSPAVTTSTFSNLFTVINGNWVIRAYDDASSDVGTLVNWSLKISYKGPVQGSITWNPTTGLTPTSGPSVTAAPASTTTYTATSTLNGCSSSNTVTVTVNPNYTITASVGANGSISPDGVTTLTCNGTGSQAYTITPNACYHVADVLVDGSSVGPVTSYTFSNVTANHTISASFALNTYTITVTAGANGSITPGTGSVNCGDNTTYTITPNACYNIAEVVVDGVSQGAVGTYTFTNVTANHTISATFSLRNYTITVTPGANGSITPGTGSIACGNNQTYTITAAPCYSIADVLVDGSSVGAVGTYTFTNIQANHTISATFVQNTYTIAATSGANGSVTPAGTSTINCGDNATYTITPNACYSIADVLVDGSSVGAVGTYTFTNVTANHTISATFIETSYTITVTAGANGSITPGTGSVSCGSNATYTITPAACYSIADVLVDGSSVGAVGTYTFTNVTANHTISATFVQTTYTITATSGANGTVTPAGTSTVNCGDNATYTITPAACYAIADVLVDGSSVGAVGTYTFTNVTVNHTISATFVQTTYTITATSGANGTVTPAGTSTVNCGDNATYTITPAACYAIADVLVDGSSVGAVGTYTFTNVTGNHTISATFVQTTYTITATSGANGTVTPAGTSTVNCGDNATYTITPAACYAIADVLVDGSSVGAVGTYTFTNVTTNHTISATFVQTTYTITATSGANGTVTPAGTSTVNCGDNATYTITPAACYAIADVLVDGSSVGAVGTYTFTNVTANHTISATFVQTTYTITATSGANGTVTPTGTSTINCGDNATYTITPAACYAIADVLVDGSSVGAVGTYTFTNVTANHTISATFVLNTYTITVTAGANGSITPGTGSVNCGANATYTISANPGYTISDVIVDGSSVGAVGSYTFTNVTANHTISATFVLSGTGPFTITSSAGTGGTISPNGSTTVNAGNNQTYTITANNCFSIADVLVDGVSVGAVGTYTFTNVQANHTISASFTQNGPYTITASSGPNGSVTPAGASVVNCGGSQSYSITPIACYHVQDVLVDGSSVGAVTTYTFSNVQANHTISATFAINASLPAPVVTGPGNICQYIGTPDPVTYTASSAGATGYSWIVPPNTTIISGQGTSTLTVSFQAFNPAQANKQIRVTALSPCGNSPMTIYYLSVQTPSTPGPITASSNNICAVIGTAGTITYTINAVGGASSYNWSAQAGTTFISHPNGLGMNDTTVTVSFTNGFSSSNITVSASNSGCGTSAVRSLTITRSNPGTPGLISGPTNACAYMAPGGTAATYSIVAVPNATSYTWSVPAGATGLTGQGTTTISFTYPATFTSGQVTVFATNGCGNSGTRTLSVSKLTPSTPGVIDVIQSQPCPNRVYTYTIATMPANATSLLWTVPAGASIISGQGTTSISVSYPSTAVNGTVTVQALSNCGNSSIRSTPVKLPACPVGRPAYTKGSTQAAPAVESMQVNVYPNPTVNDFKLQVTTSAKETINVRILDLQGRQLKQFIVAALQTTTVGSDLKAGTYMVEVRQGNNVKVTKLIKF